MLFQCSSASRKFLKCLSPLPTPPVRAVSVLFSEPKIPQINRSEQRRSDHHMFQCSSASRKFLKRPSTATPAQPIPVSVLFSEPKIPQTQPIHYPAQLGIRVSVLFSEPKIPQIGFSAYRT